MGVASSGVLSAERICSRRAVDWRLLFCHSSSGQNSTILLLLGGIFTSFGGFRA